VTRPPASGEGRSRAPSNGRGWSARDDDGWSPATAVYSSAATRASTVGPSTTRAFYPSAPARPQNGAETWTPAGPRPSRDQKAVRAVERRAERVSVEAQPRAPERGLPWWGALLVLLGIACFGLIIDGVGSIQGKGGFNVGIVVASVVAIIAVRRSHMFPVVIAPPIVYSAAALCQLYIRSSGLHDHRVVFDAAANYLVYGFPAIAASTAAVLIIAGFRLIARK
jgi:hypothetical protein